ncbi:uncharacterized protein G2W53_017888 [Senna tora]|uniref:Uncharacterized protein n=1 Tax=Senna tora TaxID=362788 RepID=A0A834TZI0_9FABA|nr:uncharacterized protein G2W53_017888 [Senna tora]
MPFEFEVMLFGGEKVEEIKWEKER